MKTLLYGHMGGPVTAHKRVPRVRPTHPDHGHAPASFGSMCGAAQLCYGRVPHDTHPYAVVHAHSLRKLTHAAARARAVPRVRKMHQRSESSGSVTKTAASSVVLCLKTSR